MKRNNYVRQLTYMAFLIALEVVLNRFCSINTLGLKIGFAFVPIVVAASLFGPVPAAIVYAISDVVGALLFPMGPYHPGFTVSAVVMGAVWGIFLYKGADGERAAVKWEMVKMFPNIIIPSLLNNLVMGLVVNTYWVSMLYGSKSYLGWALYRLTEYATLIPLNILLVPVLLKMTDELRRFVRK